MYSTGLISNLDTRPRLSISAYDITQQDCRAEARGLKDALSSANSRLTSLDALEAEARARSRELKELQEERRESNESLAEERGRTQHLVSTGKYCETPPGVVPRVFICGCCFFR